VTSAQARARQVTSKRESTMERFRSLLERYVELYNAGGLDKVMDLYAEDSA
jgi:hypothetical protein